METITIEREVMRNMSEQELIDEILLRYGPQRIHEICLRSYTAGSRSELTDLFSHPDLAPECFLADIHAIDLMDPIAAEKAMGETREMLMKLGEKEDLQRQGCVHLVHEAQWQGDLKVYAYTEDGEPAVSYDASIGAIVGVDGGILDYVGSEEAADAAAPEWMLGYIADDDDEE